MKREGTERNKYKGTHYLPPRSGKRGPPKGVTYERAERSKIDVARVNMERNQMRLLERAYCDPLFARDNPGLVEIIGGLNQTMRDALARRYYEPQA